MGEGRKQNRGLLAIVGFAIFATIAYEVAVAGPPPSFPFGVAEVVLLLSILVMIVDLVRKSTKPR